MARDTKYDVLFEPIQIGPKTLPNRFFQVAHCTSFGSERPGLQAYFRGMKAEGGWGGVSTEYCSIAPETDTIHQIGARLWDEDDVESLGQMCNAVHEHGSLAAVELWHGGPLTYGLEARVPARGASQIQSSVHLMRNCRAMDLDDIRDVQQLYVDAADRARRAGFDIITIDCSHGDALPHEFLLPYHNKRTDEYGGSFENRARFAREVTTRVREAVGNQCAISLRFGIDTVLTHGELGIRPDGEGWRFIEHLDDLVDFWDVNMNWDAGTSRFRPENHQAVSVGRVKEHTDKPVLNVGRFTNPDTMVRIIREGQCDIIGAARPSIADPFLPEKIRQGRLDDIRECIGCNVCYSKWKIGGAPIICTQNATSGEEYRRGWHPERFSKAGNSDNDVLVIGAGPAGLECARVLGERGMRRVHLVDAGKEIGGSVRDIATLPGLGEWARVINYRRIQLDKLRNVEVITGQRLDADAVREYGAEIVVVATGSHWNGNGLDGITHAPIAGADAAHPHCLTPDQVFSGKVVGERVVVYDTDGYFMAAGLAERLRAEGRAVTYVTPFPSASPYTEFTGEYDHMYPHLLALGIEIITHHHVAAVAPGSVTIQNRWSEAPTALAADSVVLVTQRESDDALYRSLKADPDALAANDIQAVYGIGDCIAPAMIADSVFSGHRLAREIDSPSPEVPLPYLRERPSSVPAQGPLVDVLAATTAADR